MPSAKAARKEEEKAVDQLVTFSGNLQWRLLHCFVPIS